MTLLAWTKKLEALGNFGRRCEIEDGGKEVAVGEPGVEFGEGDIVHVDGARVPKYELC